LRKTDEEVRREEYLTTAKIRIIVKTTPNEEDSMLDLTEGAKELLDQHFAQKTEIPSIRVYMAPG
jgi:hypothetical protein